MVFLDGYMDKEYTSVHCSHPSVEGGALAESFHSPIFSNFVLLIIRTVICFSTSAGNIVYLLWDREHAMIRIPIIVKARLGRKPWAVAIHMEPLCQECLLRMDSKALIAGGFHDKATRRCVSRNSVSFDRPRHWWARSLLKETTKGGKWIQFSGKLVAL